MFLKGRGRGFWRGYRRGRGKKNIFSPFDYSFNLFSLDSGRGRFFRGRPFYGNFQREYSPYSNYVNGPDGNYGPPSGMYNQISITSFFKFD